MFTPGFIFFKPKPTELIVRLKLGNSGVISRQTIPFLTSKSGNRNNYIRIEDMNYRKLFGQRVAVIHAKSNNSKGCNFHKTTLFDNPQSLSNNINGINSIIYHQKDFLLLSNLSNNWYLNHYQTPIAFIYSSGQKELFAQKAQNIFIEFGHLSQYIVSEFGYHLFEVNGQAIEVKNNQQKKLDNVRLSSTAIMATANQSMKTETDNIKQIALSSEVTVNQINGIEQTTYFNSHKNLTINLAQRFETGIDLHLRLTKVNGLINKIGLVPQYILKEIFAQHSDFESKLKLLELLIGDFSDYKISYITNTGIRFSSLFLLQNSHYYQLIDQSSSIASLSTTRNIQLISYRLSKVNIEIPLNDASSLSGQSATLYTSTHNLISKVISQYNTIQPIYQSLIITNHGNPKNFSNLSSYSLIQQYGSVSEFILLPAITLGNSTAHTSQLFIQGQIIASQKFSSAKNLLTQVSLTPILLDLAQVKLFYIVVNPAICQSMAINTVVEIQSSTAITNQLSESNKLLAMPNTVIKVIGLGEKDVRSNKAFLIETVNAQVNQLILVEIANWDGLTTQLWDNIEESIWNILS